MNKHILVLILLIPFNSLFGQTVVFVMATPDSVVIASDSKFRKSFVIKDSRGNETEIDSIWMGCKIFKENNICFAMAGYNYDEAVSLAKQACRKSSNTKQAAEYFKKQGKASYIKYLNTLKANTPTYFKKHDQEYGAAVIFSAFENSNFSIIVDEFSFVIKNNQIDIKDTSYSIKTPGLQQVTVRTFGHNSAIEPIVEKSIFWTKVQKPVKLTSMCRFKLTTSGRFKLTT
jgi:hypothetical protein